jgi:hypothetical protein
VKETKHKKRRLGIIADYKVQSRQTVMLEVKVGGAQGDLFMF